MDQRYLDYVWSSVAHFKNDFSIVFSNSMEISVHSQPRCGAVTTMTFCTWHDSRAVAACAKCCSDIVSYNGVTLKSIFHRIWIMMEKSFVKWAPGYRCDAEIHINLSSAVNNGFNTHSHVLTCICDVGNYTQSIWSLNISFNLWNNRRKVFSVTKFISYMRAEHHRNHIYKVYTSEWVWFKFSLLN